MLITVRTEADLPHPMRFVCFHELDSAQEYPGLADWLGRNGAGSCCVSAEEQGQDPAESPVPNGTVDDCYDFQRIFSNRFGWLNTYVSYYLTA